MSETTNDFLHQCDTGISANDSCPALGDYGA